MIAGTSRRSSICCSKQPIPTVTVVYSMAWASAGIFFLLLLEKESPVEPDDAFSNPSQRVAENRNHERISTHWVRRPPPHAPMLLSPGSPRTGQEGSLCPVRSDRCGFPEGSEPGKRASGRRPK